MAPARTTYGCRLNVRNFLILWRNEFYFLFPNAGAFLPNFNFFSCHKVNQVPKINFCIEGIYVFYLLFFSFYFFSLYNLVSTLPQEIANSWYSLTPKIFSVSLYRLNLRCTHYFTYCTRIERLIFSLNFIPFSRNMCRELFLVSWSIIHNKNVFSS